MIALSVIFQRRVLEGIAFTGLKGWGGVDDASTRPVV